MKKFIACVALLIVVNSIHSQQNNPSPTLTKKDYMQKSKHQKTAAWIFTVAGAGITGLGMSDAENNGAQSDDTRKTVLIVTGLTSMAVGLTFFILGTESKKKAESLSFKMETAPSIQQGSLVTHSYPALSFRLKL